MTKEEQKANELIEIFIEREDSEVEYGYACERALKCVDEIIKEVVIFKQHSMGGGLATEQLDYWQSVKQHILNKGK